MARLSRRVGIGFHSRGGRAGRWGGRIGGSAGVRQGLEPARCLGDHGCPGPASGQTEPAATSGVDQLGGSGEQPEPESSGFPAAGVAGQGEHRHPGQEVEREGRRSRARSGSVRCRAGAGCAGRCRRRFGSGPRSGPGGGDAVPGRRAGRPWCWSREAGQPQSVEVGEAQLGAGVGSFLADDQAHPLRPRGQVGHVGDLRDPGAGPFGTAGVIGRRPRRPWSTNATRG
jgi:hypothetical protein